jgi:hypothetical protein
VPDAVKRSSSDAVSGTLGSVPLLVGPTMGTVCDSTAIQLSGVPFVGVARVMAPAPETTVRTPCGSRTGMAKGYDLRRVCLEPSARVSASGHAGAQWNALRQCQPTKP